MSAQFDPRAFDERRGFMAHIAPMWSLCNGSQLSICSLALNGSLPCLFSLLHLLVRNLDDACRCSMHVPTPGLFRPTLQRIQIPAFG